MKRLLPILLLLAPLVAGAADEGEKIYRTVDEDGNVVYTDTPPSEDAEPVELDPVTTVPGFQGNGSASRAGEESEAPPAPVYDAVRITYPTVDEAIRHNGGQVPFEVALRPEGVELAEGHRIEIVVDGAVMGTGAPPTVTAGTINRGPHDAFARVVDTAGQVLVRSSSVNFFLLRAAISQP